MLHLKLYIAFFPLRLRAFSNKRRLFITVIMQEAHEIFLRADELFMRLHERRQAILTPLRLELTIRACLFRLCRQRL